MVYAQGRTYYDADSHIMELGDWLLQYADPGVRESLRPLYLGGAGNLADQAQRDAQTRQGDADCALSQLEQRAGPDQGRDGHASPSKRGEQIENEAPGAQCSSRATTSTCSTAAHARSTAAWPTSAAATSA